MLLHKNVHFQAKIESTFCIFLSIKISVLWQTYRFFSLLPWPQPIEPKNSKSTRFVCVFIVLGMYDFGQGSQLEGENLPSRPISSSSSLLHPYYSENFKKIPRSRSNPKTPCRNSVGQSPLTCSKKVIYLSFDEKNPLYQK